MKITKSPKSIEKKKIEKIALNLLNSNREWKNKNKKLKSNNNGKINKRNDNTLSTDTQKDILTLANYNEKINRNLDNDKNLSEFNIKNINYYSVNNNNKDKGFKNIKEEEKELSRKKSQIPKNKKEIVPRIKGLELAAKNQIDKLNHNSKEDSTLQTNSNIIESSSDSITNFINFDILNQISLIYEELKKQFYNIQKLNYVSENDNNKKDIYFKCRVLAYDYMQFLFGEEIPKIIKLFNYCLDIGKFIIYQIYLFLSIIYLDNYKKLDNSIEMSFRTIILYSSQNFNIILNLIQNPQYCSEPKKMLGIKIKNKIIISILKLINPNLPTNSQIKEFINPEKEKKQMNDNLYKIGKFPLKCLEEIGVNKDNKIKDNYDIKKSYKEERYNSMGILNLLLLLKKNKELNDKLNQIEKKVFILFDQKNNNNIPNNNALVNNIQNNMNNNNNNINPVNNNANNITSSISSLNMNNSKSNNNSSNKNRLSNINKLLLPELNINKNYKLFLIFELDETLVHYWEEKDNCYVKVRCGVEDCFSKIFDFCEITIVSTSSKEYTDIVVDNINKKKCYIQNRIYKELFDEDENFDLSLINRDKKKCIFICHEEEFFNAPKNNILQLTEFNGEESDREIIFLCKELMRIKNNDINDIREIIPEILNNVKV